MRIALTIDVETDYETQALRGVDEVLPRLLDELDALRARATFFVVGEVALQRRVLVASLCARGHLVGAHGMTHAALSRLAPTRARAELRDGKRAVEDVTGAACLAFRAPYFDAPNALGGWLAEEGYRWSSSRAPFSIERGWRDLLRPGRPHADGGVIELPVARMFGLPIPDGLSYRRLLWPLSRLAARPGVFYWHPYELLPPAADRPRRFSDALWTRRAGLLAQRELSWLLGNWRARGASFVTLDALA